MNTPTPSTLAPRFVPLCDGRLGLRGSIRVDIDQPPASPAGETAAPPILDFIASDETLDRFGEVISAAGWRLEAYRRNPVFQNAHQYGDIIFTLGKALLTEVRRLTPGDGREPERLALFQRVQFATDINPLARIAYGLYRGRFLNAVSVGFVPLRWTDSDGPAAPGGPASTPCRRRYLEQELLEVSAVSIPANPNALQLGLRSGAVQSSDLRDLADLLRGAVPAEPALLPLARALREVLKRD
jgi:hypothetical protein